MGANQFKFFYCLLIGLLALAAAPACGEDGEAQRRKLIAAVEQSVVTIEAPGVGAGSGFIVSADGVVATCYHVVEGAKEVRVKLRDGTSLDVLGFVAASPGKDLVMLKLKAAAKMPALQLATERAAKGDVAFAFGAPRGLTGSISDGIISAVRKGLELREALRQSTGGDIYVESMHYDLDAVWIQTTAPISPGNSGGPLINAKGEVVGVNAWTRTDGQNLNFAVEAKFVRHLLDDASETPHAIAGLPRINNAAGVKLASDGQKTLTYWQEINRAKQDRAEAMSRIKTLPARASSKQRGKTFFENAKAWRHYFEAVKAISVEGVDTELVALTTLDAQLSEKLTNAMQATVQLLAANKPKDADSHFSASFAQIGMPLVKVQEAYDFLRVTLTARYGMDFHAMRSNAALVQDDRERKEMEDREKIALRTLAIGKGFLNSTDATKHVLAKGWFEKVVSQYPGTSAAEEATTLLRKLE